MKNYKKSIIILLVIIFIIILTFSAIYIYKSQNKENNIKLNNNDIQEQEYIQEENIVVQAEKEYIKYNAPYMGMKIELLSSYRNSILSKDTLQFTKSDGNAAINFKRDYEADDKNIDDYSNYCMNEIENAYSDVTKIDKEIVIIDNKEARYLKYKYKEKYIEHILLYHDNSYYIITFTVKENLYETLFEDFHQMLSSFEFLSE